MCKKEKDKCNNVIKKCKKWLILMMLQKKKCGRVIQIGHKFLITYTEYYPYLVWEVFPFNFYKHRN